MGEKRPLCLYGGITRELAAGDALPGSGSLLVAETVVTGSGVTSVTFSDLDGNAAGGYDFDIEWIGNTSASFLKMLINSDGNEGNYCAVHVGGWVDNGVYNWGVAGYQLPALLVASEIGNTFARSAGSVVRSPSGYAQVMANTCRIGVGTYRSYHTSVALNHRSAISNITSLTFTSSAGIDIGSVFRLYRRK